MNFLTRRRALESMAALAAAAGLAACTPSKPQFQAVDITGVDYAKDFHLTDQNGQARSLADFRGKVVVVFFGYTQCPDVCPTTMADLAQARKQLGADGDKLQVLFVTVDPDRDTAQVLKGYMANFDPTFLALRGTPEQLAATAKDYKIYYKKVDGPTPTTYTMDHSAASYVYDAQGRLRLYARYGNGPEPLVADLKLLIAQA